MKYIVCLTATLLVLLPKTYSQSPRNPNNDSYLKKRQLSARLITPPLHAFAGNAPAISLSDALDVVTSLSIAPGEIASVTVASAVASALSNAPNFATDLQNSLMAIDHVPYSSADTVIFQALTDDFNADPAQDAYMIITSALKPIQADSINVSLIGVAGASSVDGLKQSNASVSVGFSFSWGNHYNRKTNEYHLYQRNSFYMLYNPASAVSNDSASIAKAFLFPEIGKRDFVMGFERMFPFATCKNLDYTNNEGRPNFFSFFSEFSTSHYDTGQSAFRSYNVTTGLKYTYHGEIAGLGFGIQIIPYYSFIGVEKKDWNAMDMAILGKSASDFDTLTNKGIPPTVKAFGINLKGSIASFEIFANFKYIINNKLNNNDNITNNDIKNTVLTIGIIINPQIWNFHKALGPQNRQ